MDLQANKKVLGFSMFHQEIHNYIFNTAKYLTNCDIIEVIYKKGKDNMTKAFLEPNVLKPKSESLVRKAFSRDSLEKVREYNNTKRPSLKRKATKRLSISELV